eukprot:TRINITY_DN72941_c0_g1_i1.p1 TRINITY_DN72941_c0_g1~~TRINITY_DN72941_c0_g1_i1.p1  ORF type:complete len:328 (+),score=24.96 TRINITY_DN72941_c0_g1_i1:50-985(+)
MAPLDDDDDERWHCPLCAEFLLDPVTLPCCGQSFCQDCLRGWIISKVGLQNIVRCPHSTCEAVISNRLPKVSRLLSSALEALAPRESQRRRAEAAQEPSETIRFGYEAWQEIAASKDLFIGEAMVVAFGTPGIVLSNTADAEDRVKVLFDTRLFGEGALNVTSGEVQSQLPCHFGVLKIGQRVAATGDLTVDGVIRYPFASLGTILCRSQNPVRILVEFDTLGKANVLPTEIAEYVPLVGGFFIGHRVRAALDLVSGDTLLVRKGILGVVRNQYSDTRLTIRFDSRADGLSNDVNVLPREIERVVEHTENA